MHGSKLCSLCQCEMAGINTLVFCMNIHCEASENPDRGYLLLNTKTDNLVNVFISAAEASLDVIANNAISDLNEINADRRVRFARIMENFLAIRIPEGHNVGKKTWSSSMYIENEGSDGKITVIKDELEASPLKYAPYEISPDKSVFFVKS